MISGFKKSYREDTAGREMVVGRAIPPPTMIQQLKEQEVMLQERLSLVQEAIAALETNPSVGELIEKLTRVL